MYREFKNNLSLYISILYYKLWINDQFADNSKPIERLGRKAKGLSLIAGDSRLPKKGFYLVNTTCFQLDLQGGYCYEKGCIFYICSYFFDI